MGSSFLIFLKTIEIGGWIVILELYKITDDPQRPEGFKARFVLLKIEGDKKIKCILVDNHLPFGIHHHPELPENHSKREAIEDQSLEGAINFFLKKVQEVTGEDIKNRL